MPISSGVAILYFSAKSDPASQDFVQVVDALQSRHTDALEVIHYQDDNVEAFKKYSVDAVPVSIVLENGCEKKRIVGYDAFGLTEAVDESIASRTLSLNQRIKQLVTSSPLMLFIKGTPESPRCGFTRQLFELFSKHGINDFGYFDILTDASIRQGTDGCFLI